MVQMHLTKLFSKLSNRYTGLFMLAIQYKFVRHIAQYLPPSIPSTQGHPEGCRRSGQGY